MRVALVWNHRSRLLDCSFRFEQYVAGFERLGHEAVMVCDRDSAEGWEGPLEVVEGPERFEDVGLWGELGAEVVVIVTWHRMAAVLAAIQQAGCKVVSITDTDGQIGLRVYPWFALQRMMVYQTDLVGRLKCLKYWLERYLLDGIRGSAEDREQVASTRSSDAVIMGSAEAQRNLRRYLARQGAAELGARVFVVPFTIGDAFLSCPVPETQQDRVVAIGRWDDPQKDSGLLAAALEIFLDGGATTEVVICGRGGEPWFGALAERFPGLRYLGVQDQESVARLLSESRAIVFSSRWEGSPHAALETLALGATLVGTPIPSLESWTEGGRFGTVAASHRPRQLARALRQEMAAWDQGRRQPREISRHWRARLAPEAVCGRMLAALD